MTRTGLACIVSTKSICHHLLFSLRIHCLSSVPCMGCGRLRLLLKMQHNCSFTEKTTFSCNFCLLFYLGTLHPQTSDFTYPPHLSSSNAGIANSTNQLLAFSRPHPCHRITRNPLPIPSKDHLPFAHFITKVAHPLNLFITK